MSDDLFVFGDDFEAILGILEEDEALDDEVTAIASEVSKKQLYLACILAGCTGVYFAKQQVEQT